MQKEDEEEDQNWHGLWKYGEKPCKYLMRICIPSCRTISIGKNWSGNIVELRATRFVQPEIEAAGVRRRDDMSRVSESNFHTPSIVFFPYEDLIVPLCIHVVVPPFEFVFEVHLIMRGTYAIASFIRDLIFRAHCASMYVRLLIRSI